MQETIDRKPSSFYQKELADTRQLPDETAKEKAKLQLDCNRVKSKLAEINSRYLNVKADLSLSKKRIHQLEIHNSNLGASLR